MGGFGMVLAQVQMAEFYDVSNLSTNFDTSAISDHNTTQAHVLQILRQRRTPER